MHEGDVMIKRLIELMEDYKARGLERDMRDDLIDVLAENVDNLGLMVVSYAEKYGCDAECGVYE